MYYLVLLYNAHAVQFFIYSYIFVRPWNNKIAKILACCNVMMSCIANFFKKAKQIMQIGFSKTPSMVAGALKSIELPNLKNELKNIELPKLPSLRR